MSSSLFINLTELSATGFPATELIKYLIEAAGHDVVSFRRNTQISYQLVDRTRYICNVINSLIEAVDDDETWDTYDRFTAAVDPLEQLLYKLIEISEEEAQRYLPSSRSVDDAIVFTENWEVNRRELRAALSKLYDSKVFKDLSTDPDPAAFTEEEVAESAKYDDTSYFTELRGFIENHAALDTLGGSVQNLLRDINGRLRELQTLLLDTSSEELTVIAIKSTMLIHGALSISADQLARQEQRDHLKSEPVWQAAAALFLHLCQSDLASFSALEQEYDAFVRLLRSFPTFALPDSYTQLMRLAGRIRRPFFAQALALVSLCRLLAAQFEEEDTRTIANAAPMREACDAALAALHSAVSAATDTRIVDVDDLETGAAASAFEAAEAKIEACFAQLERESLWSQHAQQLSEAREKDRAGMTHMNERFAQRPPGATTERVRVAVRICEQAPTGRVLLETSLEVEVATRLSALRWSVARQLDRETSARALRRSEFLRIGPDGAFVPCGMHDTVYDVAQGRACRLVLVLTRSEGPSA
ncbi:hypothetical protein BV25DRAFT_1842149 [Artomyces pyxidatus]|uniref:Uncharacterized protein n=1 Tax=Artomyces pyxidatus TaxID=48021 RepID=A0ACB8SKK2_9AGAM|nr:hypothetical protein BV25DRAFT_1842149 [Artomyces pyxidatus]